MSPDLQVLVRSGYLTKKRAEAIAADVNRMERHIAVSAHGRRRASLEVWAHSILSDSADWAAPVWEFEPQSLDMFENTVRRISELLKSDEWTLEACWGGERPERELAVTADDLLGLVRENRLGNRVRYRISASKLQETTTRHALG